MDLHNEDRRGLLDTVDKLRSQGISRYVDLPQIIVCGDQSSGKSSVLEAISGISFPTKDNLCTRFATELILRRGPTVNTKVCIIPGPGRTEEEKEKLSRFNHAFDDSDMGKVVEEAKTAMGLTSGGKVFSTDILRVELSGPDQPHLTMVDLPGLFLAGNKDQSEGDAGLVETLVLSYMSKPRSVILAVVSAKSDFALQQVTKHARALDPSGLRTLGLITKPDTLDPGSDSEQFYIELAQNKDVKFHLGWHVLRNRDYTTRMVSGAERDTKEAEFFSKGVWPLLSPSQVGVNSLKLRLSDVLRDQIVKLLPDVMQDVQTGIQECEKQLKELGISRVSSSEQRRYLFRISERFSHFIKAAIEGAYANPFFGNSSPGWESRRLRALVQNSLTNFAEDMEKRGRAIVVVEDDAQIAKDDDSAGKDNASEDEDDVSVDGDDASVDDAAGVQMSRSKYVKATSLLLSQSRGRELPGTFNPLVVTELFCKQCAPWSALVHELVDCVMKGVQATVSSASQHSTDVTTASNLLEVLIRPAVAELLDKLLVKIDELLKPHSEGHPITYNHYLTETVQKIQSDRNKRALEKKFESIVGRNLLGHLGRNRDFSIQELLSEVIKHTEPDMNLYASSMAVDMSEAYYKVALKRFVDDVAVLALEGCLMQKLPLLFTHETVCDLTDEEVQAIAGENKESTDRRKRMDEKLRVLEDGKAELKRLRTSRS